MQEVEADALAKAVFGPRARASETRRDVRIYLYSDALHLRLLAKGESWSEAFRAAVNAEQPATLG